MKKKENDSSLKYATPSTKLYVNDQYPNKLHNISVINYYTNWPYKHRNSWVTIVYTTKP